LDREVDALTRITNITIFAEDMLDHMLGREEARRTHT
jgi:hypothetical protein